jgi:protein-S-isoprenylcysteine O-methyltransferase Ste14
MTPRQMIDVPPLWLALFAALAWLQGRFLPVGGFGAWGNPLGAILIAGGLALALAAILEFRRHRTTVVPHQEASALVTSGVYRLSRNPIYLGDAAILAGLSLVWDAHSGFVLVPGFMALIAARFIGPEEARLRAAFGATFEAWVARTRRWL